MSMVVFTLKCLCTTMIVDGFQPQTCTGTWCGMSYKLCVMHWRTRCGRGVKQRVLRDSSDAAEGATCDACSVHVAEAHARL